MDPQKKRQQLLQRKRELLLAIKKGLHSVQLHKIVEKYKLARIGMLKAQLHEKREREFEKKMTTLNDAKIKAAITDWESKSVQAIISEAQNNSGNQFH